MGVQPDMLEADLPHTMLESVSQKHKYSVYLPHLNFNHSGDHHNGFEGTSLLASLQVSAHKRNLASNVTTSFLYDVLFKVAVVACIVIMILTITLRLIQWRKHYNKVSYRSLPTVECQRRRGFLTKKRHGNYNTHTPFAGVTVPLLQDVSDV